MEALLFWERKPATLKEDLKNSKISDSVHFSETPPPYVNSDKKLWRLINYDQQ